MIIIKHRYKLYILFFLLLLFFSFKDFYNNKRIIRYSLSINFYNDNLIFSKFREKMFKDFGADANILDEKLYQYLDIRPAIGVVQTLGYVKNEFLKEENRKLFLSYLKNQNLKEKKLFNIYDDVVSNMKQNYFITLENGSLVNEIIFKTFYPEYSEKYLNILSKNINGKIKSKLNKIEIEGLNYSLKNLKNYHVTDAISKIRVLRQLMYQENINPLRQAYLSTVNANIFERFENILDKNPNIEIEEILSSDDFISLINFVEENKIFIKKFYNKFDLNFNENLKYKYNLIKFYEDKIKNIEKIKNTKNYIKIEKRSDDRLLDLFDIWSKFLMLVLSLLIIELIIKKIKKQ